MYMIYSKLYLFDHFSAIRLPVFSDSGFKWYVYAWLLSVWKTSHCLIILLKLNVFDITFTNKHMDLWKKYRWLDSQ